MSIPPTAQQAKDAKFRFIADVALIANKAAKTQVLDLQALGEAIDEYSALLRGVAEAPPPEAVRAEVEKAVAAERSELFCRAHALYWENDGVCPICRADDVAGVAEAPAAQLKLLAALIRYGTHERGCASKWRAATGLSQIGPCDCGLDAAIAKAIVFPSPPTEAP